ncbi:putative biphenyl-2,3-diol 1,2-dioxygenase III [Sphingobium sp. TA15]|uniref:BphC-like dioxygenase n=4 Tax=Sphingomonadaceae TaxID=41297 RepID=D4Z8G6_SPHIU|nr:biphenyl 2,3-dioxygenase [Sphingobium indicum F2]RYM01553.1 biphenyl 2,3-dioxygenase [Sphingobium indicum]BAI98785.1 BphC-like dioxygenase [Sphingobium indicum UT26S]BDD68831.1 putative biphenyl-2,3-diol 1,2-dioxygenase III [Sphingobium sp. TA15]
MVSATESSGRRVRPHYMAHFVIRTSRYDESLAWYQRFFDTETVYAQDGLTFLTFDDEHHRIAIGRIPDLEDHRENIAGVDHIAFSMQNLEDLVTAYERNKAAGIVPFWCINHGPTTSIYYKDPDGVKIELQVDNATFPGGARAFFSSDEFARNSYGIEFDPDDFVARFRAGESTAALLARPDTLSAGE